MSDKKQCTATSKQSGKRCKNAPSIGRETCRFHGGTAKRGIDHPAIQNAVSKTPGGHSKYLDVRLGDRYMTFLNDPELLSLRDNVALYKTRLTQLMQRIDTGDSKRLWQDANNALKEYEDAQRDPDQAMAVVRMKRAIQELKRVIRAGMQDYAIWDEIFKTGENLRKTAESEHKRGVEMGALITAQQALAIVTAIMAVVAKNVTDEKAMADIRTGIMSVAQTVIEAPPSD